jgi:hypothetical protein
MSTWSAHARRFAAFPINTTRSFHAAAERSDVSTWGGVGPKNEITTGARIKRPLL